MSDLLTGDLNRSAMNKFEKEVKRSRPIDALEAISTFAHSGWSEGLRQGASAAHSLAREVRAGILDRSILKPVSEHSLHGETAMLFWLLTEVFPD